ncbi:MAG: ComEC/Rec2 family competence protein [Thermodesulfobacteriota bacterium]
MDLDTDILVVPHHGGKESGDEIFLKAVSPSVALVSAGFGNRFGHPRPETLRRLSETGATLYRTDLDGAILIDHFQREPRLRTYWDLKMKPRKSLADEFRNFELALGFLR